jgi:ABC-2 type transport system permease protein
MKLVRSELLKILTTNLWWILLLAAVPAWAIAVGVAMMADPADAGTTTEVFGETIVAPSAAGIATNFYTAGQYVGLFFVFLLGVLLMTNEFQHRTAALTFLHHPRRTPVVIAKVAAAGLIGLLGWMVITAANIVIGAVALADRWGGTYLGDASVWGGIMLNGLTFVLWAIFGVGLGTLMRSQVGAVVVAAAIYFLGPLLSSIGLFTLSNLFGEAVTKVMAFLPFGATSAVTVTDGELDRWIAALVLLSYGAVSTVVGTLLVRRREIL